MLKYWQFSVSFCEAACDNEHIYSLQTLQERPSGEERSGLLGTFRVSPAWGKWPTLETWRGVTWEGRTRPPASPPASSRRLMNKLWFDARDTPHRWRSWESEKRALRSLNVKSAELSCAAIGADVLSARLLAHDKQNVRSPAASCTLC